MKLWEFKVIDPNSPHWTNPGEYKGRAVIRAISERRAAVIAGNKFTDIGQERFIDAQGRPDLTRNPWTVDEAVSCEVYKGSEYSADGEEGILFPPEHKTV